MVLVSVLALLVCFLTSTSEYGIFENLCDCRVFGFIYVLVTPWICVCIGEMIVSV